MFDSVVMKGHGCKPREHFNEDEKSIKDKISHQLFWEKSSFETSLANNPALIKESTKELKALLRGVMTEPAELDRILEVDSFINSPMKYIGEMVSLGRKLEEVYRTEVEAAGKSVSSFPCAYFDEAFEHKLLENKPLDSYYKKFKGRYSERQWLSMEHREGVYYPYPVMEDDTFSVMDNWTAQNKLYQSLAKAASVTGKPTPLFLGFVQPEVAREYIREYSGFRDHALSSNILHTKYVHDLQLSLLRQSELLDDELLEKMVSMEGGGNGSLWNSLIDRNCLAPDNDCFVGEDAIQHFCLSLSAPSQIYPLISSQQLSKSVSLCANKGSSEQVVKLYHSLSHDSSEISEEQARNHLITMARHINAVEVSMISANYKDMIKAGVHVAPHFEKKFAEAGAPYVETHPALKAIEMFDKSESKQLCQFIADKEIEGIGKKVFDSQIKRNWLGIREKSADGKHYVLKSGDLISKDYSVLLKQPNKHDLAPAENKARGYIGWRESEPKGMRQP
ncbi:hypothetical protein [Endozoicomonas sp. OPT23]|uniref:hypothetical protein n=1 Tax=Endozoicomonas sp. OPT23 TaxID=2072845 RepID=UPI00129BCFAE|nr:hypothetical protein [Endozoicomonas sp. OPT23]